MKVRTLTIPSPSRQLRMLSHVIKIYVLTDMFAKVSILLTIKYISKILRNQRCNSMIRRIILLFQRKNINILSIVHEGSAPPTSATLSRFNSDATTDDRDVLPITLQFVVLIDGSRIEFIISLQLCIRSVVPCQSA